MVTAPISMANGRREHMRVKVVPLNFFTDDMSGNRTKKQNKFDSWSFVSVALPLKERNQLENTYFVSTYHEASAMEMLPALVDDLLKLENGMIMYSWTGEPFLVTAPLQFILADNARHAEIASTLGSTSNLLCRKCSWNKKSPLPFVDDGYISLPRSEVVVTNMWEEFLATGDFKGLKDSNAGYKISGGQALLPLRSFDTMKDCTIELLHSILLGVGKDLLDHLMLYVLKTEDKKEVLQSFLWSYQSSGFSRNFRSSLRLRRSFLGRDLKILVQQIPIALTELLESRKLESCPLIHEMTNCFVLYFYKKIIKKKSRF